MSDYYKLREHVGHNLTVVDYASGEELAVECEDCHTVLYSVEPDCGWDRVAAGRDDSDEWLDRTLDDDDDEGDEDE